MKITINKKQYPVQFGFRALKILCKKWGVKKVSLLNPFFQKLDFKDEPDFEQWDLLGDLALAGVEAANPKSKFTREDLLDAMFKCPDSLKELMEEFSESMPSNEDVNPETRGKS